MPNTIQIKRSAGNTAPASLTYGELAYSFAANTLYVGNSTSLPVVIGGFKYTNLLEATPGTLTASKATIADANSWINTTKQGSLELVGTSGGTSLGTIHAVITSTSLTGANNTNIPSTTAVKAYVDASAASIGGASDANIVSPANGHLLIYDSVTSKWDNALITGTNNIVITATAGGLQISQNTVPFGAGGGTITGQLLISNTTASTTNTTGALVVTGGIGTSGSVTVGGGITAFGATELVGSANVKSTTVSTSTATGALRVAGGLGVLGAIWAANVNGLWTGTTISPDKGGTGSTTAPSTGQVMVGTSGGVYAPATIAAGNNIVITAASGALTLGLTNDVVIVGNLTVSGTTTTVSTTNLEITDPIMKLARTNTTTDVVDVGLYGAYYNGSAIKWAGLTRKATDKKFYLWDATTEPTTVANTTTLSTLVASIESASATITGGTFSGVTISSLATDLAVADGGTGKSSWTLNGVVFASATGVLSQASGTAGQVLQLDGSGVPSFGALDGGTY
jgi:hypothetical protein